MGVKFNPFTGQLDLTGSGSGGGPVDASSVTYFPDDSGNWSPVPSNAAEGLDQLALRLTALQALNNEFQIYIDAVAGDDTTGTGSVLNPVQTVHKAVTLVTSATDKYVFFLAPGTYTGIPLIIPGNVSLIGNNSSLAFDVTMGVEPGSDISPTYSGVGLSNITMDLSPADVALPVFYNSGFNITRVDATTGAHVFQVFDGSINNLDLTGNAAINNVLFTGTCTIRNGGQLLTNGCIIGINVVIEEQGAISMVASTFVGSITGTDSPPNKSIVRADATSLGYGGTITDCDLQYVDDSSKVGYSPATPGDWLVTPTQVQEALDELVSRVPLGTPLTGVLDSNSIDFSVSGGTDVTGDVKLSTVPADSNYKLVNLDIQTDGIRAEIADSSIKSAALDLQGPNTLLDNTTSTAISYAHASNKFTFIDYSIERNGSLRCGRLLIVNDSSSATIADNGFVEQGTVGVSFGVVISGSNVQIQYTTTNTGFNATFKYSLKQWS